MGQTLNRDYPFPERSETPDVQLDVRQLAEALDLDVKTLVDRLVTLETPAPIVRASSRGSNFDIPSGGSTSRTPIAFNSDVANLGGITLANGTTFTVPKAGLYSLSLVAAFNPAANGTRGIGVTANGTGYWLDSDLGANATFMGTGQTLSGSLDLPIPKGGTVEFFAGQNSGATLPLLSGVLLASIALVTETAP